MASGAVDMEPMGVIKEGVNSKLFIGKVLHVFSQDLRYACQKSVIGHKTVITSVLREYQNICKINFLLEN